MTFEPCSCTRVNSNMSIASYENAYLEIFSLESNHFLELFCLMMSSFTVRQIIVQSQCFRTRVGHFRIGSDRPKAFCA